MGNKNKGHKAAKIIFTVICVTLSISALCVIGVAVWINTSFEDEVDISRYNCDAVTNKSNLYYYEFEDRYNRVGKAVPYPETVGSAKNSIRVEYDELPKRLIDSFLAIEDKRFYHHNGIDIKRTAGAVLNYIFKGGNSYGGSTITQQVVKNITGNSEYSIDRKVQEMLYAMDLERKMSKEDILCLYLNIINLAHGNCGVGEAAAYYFSKDVSELTLAECASLAAIASSPSNLDPQFHADNNKLRRNMILGLMLEQGSISDDEYQCAVQSEVTVNLSENTGDEMTNSWYVDMAIEDIIGDLSEKYGYSYEESSNMVYSGGLNIYLAIDPDIQRKLESYYSVKDNFPIHEDGTTAESAAIIIDSRNGDILGVVGARKEKNGNRMLDLATRALHPTGSVIKPLSVYAPAMDRDLITYASVYDDTPVTFINSSANSAQLRPWPYNADFKYKGLANINYAVRYSINTVAVKVLEDLGTDNSFDFLYNDLNIKNLIDGENNDRQPMALALGQMSHGITLREIAAAYSIFSSAGQYNGYRSYFRVTDHDGRILLSNDYDPRQVISSDTACIMTKILQNVVSSGTAHNVTLDSFIDCAAKTGTTQGDCDKWMIGFTPYYICGVWYGYEYPRTLTGLLKNPCVDIWDDIMTDAHDKILNSGDIRSFEMDPNVVTAEYCVDSGKLMTTACKNDPRGARDQIGYFKKGTEPRQSCDRHILVPYDTQHGGVAGIECPYENVEYVGLIRVDRAFPIQVYISDAQYIFRPLPESRFTVDGHSAFFSDKDAHGNYYGISPSEYQYNRACPYCREAVHSEDWFSDEDTFEE